MTVRHYHAPHWLPGGHARTIRPRLIKGSLPCYRRERWDTPDADFIDLDWIDGKPDAPCIALFHDLEGSSRSHCARPLLDTLQPPIPLLHAANDPILPPQALPQREALPAAVTLEAHRRGGHAGFVHDAPPERIDWLPERLLAHFAAHLPSHSGVR